LVVFSCSSSAASYIFCIEENSTVLLPFNTVGLVELVFNKVGLVELAFNKLGLVELAFNTVGLVDLALKISVIFSLCSIFDY